jgi:hypothetical protein
MYQRDGSNLNDHLVFVVPTSPFRIWLFFLSIIVISYPFVSPIAVPSLLSCEYLQRMAPVSPYLMICSFSAAVVIVEFAWLFSPSWSHRSYFFAIIILGLVFLMLASMDVSHRAPKYFC